MDPILIGLLGTVFGGAGLKIVEALINRGKNREDTAAALRKELRDDLARLREELKEEAKEADLWQGRFWQLKASTMMANHKVDRVIDVVDEKHPEAHLSDELDCLKNPDK